MSRRTVNPAAERAAQNAQTIKSLLKLGGNKICADCKRNKHPRWASWNLGVFICIRCSGIHRGMGTHISRVKSVDLDAWTDEQLQSILKWGNLRANKYWESKLPSGHVPSESKIENFIRTKYESKRWVLEGPIPDPSTIEVDGDDDIPLGLVKEKHVIDRPSSQRTSQSQPADLSQSNRTIPQPDLLEATNSIPSRNSPSTSSNTKLPLKSVAAPPKQMKPADSLLGLDFFGTGTTPPTRPVSTTPMSGTQTRPDLKQSILSLYATAPRPQQQPVSQNQGLFGSIKSSVSQPVQNDQSGSISDAFSSLRFSGKNTASPVQSESPAFPDMGNNTSNHNKSNSQTSFQLSGGGFFNDNKPAVTSVQHSGQCSSGFSLSNEFGTFNSAPGSSPTVAKNGSTKLSDLFDFSTPSISTKSLQAPAPALSVVSPVVQQTSSVFNLTQTPPTQPEPVSSPLNSNLYTNSDAWGSSDAWASSSNPKTQNQPIVSQPTFDDSGWGDASRSPAIEARNKEVHGISGAGVTLPVVSADEDFEDWSGAATVTATAPTPMSMPGTNASTITSSATQKSAAGFTGNDDLFSNVWG